MDKPPYESLAVCQDSNVRPTMVLIFPGFNISAGFHGFSLMFADFRRRLRICADISQMLGGCFADFRGFSQIFADLINRNN